MRTIRQLWINIWSSLWFVPALLVLGAILLAFGLIELDERLGRAWLERWPRLFGAGVEGSRGLLTAIATSIITVAGVTFSITVVALAQASSQYSPLVLRNYMRDRANQMVLGVFGGIFVYCLVVLRSIRGGEAAFVPSIAVFVALLHAIAAVGFLLYFLHHIATVLQATSILQMVARSTLKAIDRLFPEELTESEREELEEKSAARELRRREWHPVHQNQTGFIQAVRTDAMVKFACKQNTVVRMQHGVGDFVIADTPIAFVALDAQPNAEAVKSLTDLFIIGEHRTVDQDPAFGVRQIVDMAVKALSPAMNDSTTACSCLNYLGAILMRLSWRRMPTQEHFADGKLRVIAAVPTFADFVALAFDEVVLNARHDATVLGCILDTIELVALQAGSSLRRQVLLEQLARAAEHGMRSLTDPNVRQRLQRRAADAVQAIEAAAKEKSSR